MKSRLINDTNKDFYQCIQCRVIFSPDMDRYIDTDKYLFDKKIYRRKNGN